MENWQKSVHEFGQKVATPYAEAELARNLDS